MQTVTLLIDATPHVLDASAAIWLEETIRQRFSDDTGRPLDLDRLDPAGAACMRLADVIGDDLRNGGSVERIELGNIHIGALLALLTDVPSDSTLQLGNLADGCRRHYT